MCNEVSRSVNQYERGKIEGACGSVPDHSFTSCPWEGGWTECIRADVVLDISLDCRAIILIKVPNENAMAIQRPRRAVMADIFLFVQHPQCSISQTDGIEVNHVLTK